MSTEKGHQIYLKNHPIWETNALSLSQKCSFVVTNPQHSFNCSDDYLRIRIASLKELAPSWKTALDERLSIDISGACLRNGALAQGWIVIGALEKKDSIWSLVLRTRLERGGKLVEVDKIKRTSKDLYKMVAVLCHRVSILKAPCVGLLGDSTDEE